MVSAHETAQNQKEFTDNKTMFIVFSVIMLLGIAFTVLSASGFSIIFITLAFIGFLNAGINLEMSARKLDPHAH